MEIEHITVICKFVAVLVANVVKDDKEWNDWGLPFISMVFEAQVGKDGVGVLLEEINSKFCPVIGHGLSFMLEYSDKDDFMMVNSSYDYVSSVLSALQDQPAFDFEKVLNTYLENFLSASLAADSYDARSRTVARRMCVILDISVNKLGDMEKAMWSLQRTCDPNKKSCASPFPSVKEANIDPRTLVTSFRLWRVAFIAAGGGAMMAVASRLAAPTIMETLLSLLCATTTVGQVSLAMNAILSCVGLSAATVPYLVGGSYGAAVAGYRMLKRTEPLKEFILEPLHMPTVSHGSGIFSGEFASMLVNADSEEDGDDEHGDSQEKEKTPSIQEQSFRRPAGRGKKAKHLSVFILVAGHVSEGVDPRVVWGANGMTTQHSVTSVVPDKDVVVVPPGTLPETVAKTVIDTTCVVPQVVEVSAVRTSSEGASSKGEIDDDEDDAATAVTVPDKDGVFGRLERSVTHPKDSAPTTADLLSSAHSSSSDGADSYVGGGLSEWEEVRTDQGGWWKDIVLNGDEYILFWDRSVLEQLHESFQHMLADKFQKMVYDEVLKYTPVSAIKGAASLPLMILSKLEEINDPWVVAMDRARQAGVMLARILLAEHRNHTADESGGTSNNDKRDGTLAVVPGGKVNVLPYNATDDDTARSTAAFHDKINKTMESYACKLRGKGRRPVTLVGYGMGARVIFHCLETLAETRDSAGNCIGRGIVENAVLIGAPVGTVHAKWAAARSVVAGRLVNCYSTKDWLLAILYRTKTYDVGVAGLAPIVLHPETEVAASSSSQKVNNTGSTGLIDCKNQVSNEENKARLTAQLGGGLPDVENVDVTHMVNLHSDYPLVLPNIISLIKL